MSSSRQLSHIVPLLRNPSIQWEECCSMQRYDRASPYWCSYVDEHAIAIEWVFEISVRYVRSELFAKAVVLSVEGN
jgi:hypothetical protein